MLVFVWLGCASPEPDPVEVVEVRGVPHVVQRPDFCGEACVEMAAKHLGFDVTQDDVFDASGLDPALGRGVYARELRTAMENLGFAPGPTFYGGDVADDVLDDLVADLRGGVPSVLCVHAGDAPGAPEHFVLVTGYEPEHDRFVYQDPGHEDGADQRLARDRLRDRAILYDSFGSPWIVRLRAALGTPIPPVPEEGLRPHDYVQALIAARAKAPPGFTVVLERPFVVAGAEPHLVAARAETTVRRAVQGLRRNHFDEDPEFVFTAWLFENDASYRYYARELFGDDPSTPYGYADLEERALVMNIATGGGTLVHEMVHPYIHAELPDAPPWFNEGLASLYEGTTWRDDTIRGTVNWRLRDLQQVTAAGMLLDLPSLMALDQAGFYSGASGLYYAESRYLFFWLQEHGLLERYYRDYRGHHAEDPTGVETLRSLLGTDDLAAFQQEWEAWVMELRFE